MLDLPEHRKIVMDACLRMGMFPVMMESLPPSDEDPVTTSLRLLDDADVYLGVFAHRYGYVPKQNNPQKISLSEMEYNRALERRIPCLIFLMDETHPFRREDVEENAGASRKFKAFKARLLKDRMVSFFTSPDHLRANVTVALAQLRQSYPDTSEPDMESSRQASESPSNVSSAPATPRVQSTATSSRRTKKASQRPQAAPAPPPPIVARIREIILADSAVASSATSDQPISDPDKDKLDFVVYASALRDFIASKDTATPLTISVEAPWGHGKSSLMRMIQHQLNPRRVWYRRWWIRLKLQLWRLRYLAIAPIWHAGKFIVWLAKWRQWKSGFLTDLTAGMVNPPPASQEVKTEEGEDIEQAPVRRFMQWCAWARLPVEAQHPTVWFNAWKYDQEEAIWSALASAILEQIKSTRSWMGRLLLWVRLFIKRANRLQALRDVLRKIFWPMLLAFLWWLWRYHHEYVLSLVRSSLDQSQIDFIMWLLGGGFVLTSGVKLASIIEDPFSLPFDKYVNTPDYQKKIGFIGEFEQDFKRIVELVTCPVWGWRPRKLIIFIDDLDRCEPPKSADVIEAINVFLDSPGCVFVLGMDSRAVIASIETKYEKMFTRLQHDSPDHATLGRNFLEKIIQVPFAIPSMSDRSMEPYVIDIIGPQPAAPALPESEGHDQPAAESTQPTGSQNKTPQAQMASPAGEERKEDIGSYSDIEVWRAIRKGVMYLDTNPRQLKRFINLFRVQTYISKTRKLFYESMGEGKSNTGYTLDSLAAWTVFSMRWPVVVTALAQESQQGELRQWLFQISQSVDERGMWLNPAKTGALMKRLLSFSANGNFSLSTSPETETKSGDTPSESPAPEDGKRETVRQVARNWRNLPWDSYFGNRDFLQVVKALEGWWIPPEQEEKAQEQRDWLSMAMMFQQ